MAISRRDAICGISRATVAGLSLGVLTPDALLAQAAEAPGAGAVAASDRHYVDEPMTTLRHAQVTLAWLMNNEPIPPKHGAPLRLVIPFGYGNRSIKAITEIIFSTPGLPALPLPA